MNDNLINGEFIQIDNDEYYKISNYHLMSPFFINIVSNGDIWMFMSSMGGITAGRKNSSGAIFPYETDDKIHDQSKTGSKTIIKVDGEFWEPFEKSDIKKYNLERNIFKNIFGNKIIFQEINYDLNISFSYKLESSDKFGIVRTSKVNNLSNKNCSLEILDGYQNILPYGVENSLQATSSCLVDAYKASELDSNNNLAIYSLTTIINDSPNPIESLRANVAWTNSTDYEKILLSSDQIQNFCNSKEVEHEIESYGTKSAYLLLQKFNLKENCEKEWKIVLDVGFDLIKIAELKELISTLDFNFLNDDISKSDLELKKIIGLSDGFQMTNDKEAINHNILNVLYNDMRGGIFIDGYKFDFDEYYDFIKIRNKKASRDSFFLSSIKLCNNILELKTKSKYNKDYYRLSLEFMPLYFSRRHGDPSRPWNAFNIEVKNNSGKNIYNYEGNWRDIFQNWEALSFSFPLYIENMVAKFVNASTVDGFNPYRINKKGIEWEKPEENNPFSGYGYWGDHQIIYLLKLLEQMKNHFGDSLQSMLKEEIFTYANVPYEIKPFEEILKDSKNTIYFDSKKDEAIEKLVSEIGSDGKLLFKDGDIYYVSLIEKLLVPLLSKLSNLYAGGGIWMNTQRPEWNDANNAIVGIGLSMVTTYNLYQYVIFIKEIFNKLDDNILISNEIIIWLQDILKILESFENKIDGKAMLLDLGNIFDKYRKNVYKNGFSGKSSMGTNEIKKLLDISIFYLRYTIEKNEDELFSSYNLLKEDFSISKMKLMLEGQTAILSSGYLDSKKVISLVEKMLDSSLYSNQLENFYLYPVNKTKPFINKNIISNFNLKIDDNIFFRDINGDVHFNSELTNEATLNNKLEHSNYTDDEKNIIKTIYEDAFGHKKFTGRSSVMYKYEGIGCIYWHQNSKFLLALFDSLIIEYKTNGLSKDAKKIKYLYDKLSNGMGYRKSPSNWGAFTLDPYSHTSYNGKAQQPGMTGQVKEDILTRFKELGVIISDEKISFNLAFINEYEYLHEDEFFTYLNIKGLFEKLPLAKNSLAFTICQVPVVINKNAKNIEVKYFDGTKVKIKGLELDKFSSKEIFSRTEKIMQIELT